MLSSRLKAFVIPTSQTTAIGTAIQSFFTSSTVSPFETTIAVAPNWAASFAQGGSEKASSSRPTANRSPVPPRIASSSVLPPTAPARIARPTPASSPVKIPIPPTAGVSRLCQRSSLGFAANTPASGERRATQITKPAVGKATAETSAIIAPEITHASVLERGNPHPLRACGGSHEGALYTAHAMSIYADLIHYRELFANLFRRDLRTKYKGSVLGVMWSLVNPLILMGIYTLVFSVLFPLNFALISKARGTVWLALPLAVPIIALVGGLALAIAAATVVFRDVEHIVAALLLPWFFLTPIMYSFSGGGALATGIDHHHTLVQFIRYGNFLTPPIEAVRDPLFWGKMPRAGDVVYLCVAALIALALGAYVFNRVDDRIAVEL